MHCGTHRDTLDTDGLLLGGGPLRADNDNEDDGDWEWLTIEEATRDVVEGLTLSPDPQRVRPSLRMVDCGGNGPPGKASDGHGDRGR